MTLILILALTLEWLVGDPQTRWHPVALFGCWAAWCESFLYADEEKRGVIAWLFVIAVPFALLCGGHLLLGWPFDVLLLWASIGWKSLFEHVRSVLDADAVGQAREAVSLIVSRDTGNMSKEDTRRAALESLAENASDAVVAPLFWFALLGPLGATGYRMVNTLDAMWGYRSERYQAFGWCAAKVDDAANLLPARITARLMLWAGKSAPWTDIRLQAQTHVSPNAGWPEVALAYAADVQLGGPVVREGIVDERPFYGSENARDTDAIAAFDALQIVRNSLLLAAALAVGVSLAL
jgi:adenosylcobinamide-phosphate synthase